MASYEEQQKHLRRLMEEVPTDEEARTEYDVQSDAGEVDFVEVSTKTVRTRKEDKVLRLPISRLATRTLKTPIEIFKYFINDEMVDLIVEHTNAYIDSVSDNFERERDARSTNITKIHALLCLLFDSGVLKANRLNLELWQSDGSGVEMFRLTMSIKHFKFLLRCLRFDNKQTREERKKIDKLAPIENFSTSFSQKIQGGGLWWFYSILNVAGINSLVVYGSNNPIVNIIRRSYLRNIAYDLIPPHLRIRVAKENIPRQLKNRLREICGIQDISGLLNRNREGETGRCPVCSSKRNRKT
ncbi:hypothetical protein NQ314_009931, partial [Rhamnusium bicolor]